MCLLVASIILGTRYCIGAVRNRAQHSVTAGPARSRTQARAGLYYVQVLRAKRLKGAVEESNMQGDGLFFHVPIWGFFIGTLLLVLVSVEAGYRWARYRQTRSQQEKEAPVGAMVGATLGLLAFLLAITFAMAADSFHARRVALLDEVNAIRTAYLRTDLIVEPQRTEVRKLLAEYVDQRLHWVGVGDHTQPSHSSQELHDRLWALSDEDTAAQDHPICSGSE